MDSQHHYQLTIAYDGTDFCGWQIQPNGVSIQELVEKALAAPLRQHINVVGAGRTDAGVHALGQVAHFRTTAAFDSQKLLVSLNGLLPPSIRVLTCTETSPEFHARYSALGKEYHYYLTLDRFQSPFHRHYRWHVRHHIDVDLLKSAAQLLVGTHDFTSFANEAHKGSAAKDPVRTLWRVDVLPDSGGVRIEFEGEGFLYKMVRNIVGTLIEIASGKRPIEDIPRLLANHDRRLAGRAAPPQGLVLVKVRYPDIL